jgi:hypothetical protein
MRKVASWAAIAGIIELIVFAIVVHFNIKDFLWTHPWWHSFIVGLPAIFFGIADKISSDEANSLRKENNQLKRDLDTERNRHLGQIARNLEREPGPSEKNAEIVRKYLGSKVVVGEHGGRWSVAPLIVEISDSNLVTLFTPYSNISMASCVTVRSEDVEIVDIPEGDCPIRLRILKRYGDEVQLGQITRWEDRGQPVSTFVKGDAVYWARYSKPGSAEQRSLHVYTSRADSARYMLEASTGEKTIGDRIGVSKDFMAKQIDYQSAGFQRNSAGGGGGLFVC